MNYGTKKGAGAVVTRIIPVISKVYYSDFVNYETEEDMGGEEKWRNG